MKPTQMSLDITQLSSETLNTVEQLNNLVVASSSSDWGGLAGPIAGNTRTHERTHVKK